MELFFDKIPTKNSDEAIINWQHIEELDSYTLLKRQGKFESQLCVKPLEKHPYGVHDQECIKEYLKKHPLFEILKGMPLAISIVAS